MLQRLAVTDPKNDKMDPHGYINKKDAPLQTYNMVSFSSKITDFVGLFAASLSR